DLVQQRGLVLVHADVHRRVLELELHARHALGVLLGDGHHHHVAAGNQLDLAGEVRGDGRVVVLEALDGGAFRGNVAQLDVLDGAAGDADGLAIQVVEAGDGGVFRAEHAEVEGRVGGGEVDHCFTLGVLAQAGYNQVDLAGGEERDAVGAVDWGQLQLHRQLVGQQLRGIDIEAARFHVRADRAERREILRYGDFQYAGLADVFERIGVNGAGAEGQGGEEGTQQCAVKSAHVELPINKGKLKRFAWLMHCIACARFREVRAFIATGE